MTARTQAQSRAAIQELRSWLEPQGYRLTVREGGKHTVCEVAGHENGWRFTMSRGANGKPPEHARNYARQAAAEFLKENG